MDRLDKVNRIRIASVLLALGLFVFDLVTPRDVATSVLYVGVVLLSLWVPDRRSTMLSASVCSALTIAGFFLSAPAVNDSWQADSADRLLGLVAIWVTAALTLLQKRTTQEVIGSEKRLGAIVDTATDGIITFDQRGVLLSLNPAAERMFGYGPGTGVGQPLALLMPQAAEELRATIQQQGAFATDRNWSGEVLGQSKEGRGFPIWLSVSDTKLPSQQIFTGIVRDLTEVKKAQRQALLSQRLAAIGEAVAGLAHESRNALQRIDISASQLSESVTDPNTLETVADIQEAGESLQRLFEDVRRFAAPIQLRRSSCNLASIWREAWLHLEPLWDGRNVQFKESTAGVELTCEVDAPRLEQVFRNVFDNALAACSDPVKIDVICTSAQLLGHAAIKLRLCDNGPGIIAERRERIFEPFFTTKTSGTGLGMAIAQRLVEAHGGTLELAASDAPGAQFVLTLPAQLTPRLLAADRAPVSQPSAVAAEKQG